VKIRTLALAAMLAAVGLVAGCASLRDANPSAAGCDNVTPQSATICGYAVYGSTVIAQETAVKVARDLGTGRVTDAIIAAEDKLKPAQDKLYQALVEYETIRSELAAGSSTQAKLDIALANVNTWVDRVAPLLRSLRSATTSGPN
jgi:hypothetical protein